MSAINTSTVNSINVNSSRADNVENDFQAHDSSVAKSPMSDIVTGNKTIELVAKADSSEQQGKVLISSEQLEKVAQNLQDFVGEMNKGLEFSVDKDSGRDVIKVIDKKSGNLIKQYPTEEVLDLVAKLSEATGNFINTDV
ncbi:MULTISPECIES: flagellar protein FlaG [unclassified Colwellia]|uniref:flagellar protein FlaG n=1 Tax=unclassified Colwellia TaxID=196834 RepID=UPI0021751954|nr:MULTISPECIES: flagellar protein FlaG [unclassified Colwellia]